MQMSFYEFLAALGLEALLLVCAFVAGLMVGRKHPNIANLIAQDAATLEAALQVKQATATAAATKTK
jgi:hypothetical protein